MPQLDLHPTPTAIDGHAAGRPCDEAEFRCSVDSRGGWSILVLAGELDMSHLAEVRTALIDLQLTRGGRLAVDLRDLSFMDSAGVRVILQAMAHAALHGADFAVIRGHDSVQRILEVVGLADQLPIVDDLGSYDAVG